MEDYVRPLEDEPEGPAPQPEKAAGPSSSSSFPLVADLRPGIARTRFLRVLGRIIALVGAWGLLGGLWAYDVVYWSGRSLAFPPIEYWTVVTLVLLGLPVLVTIGVWRSRDASLPVGINVDAGGFSLTFSGASLRRWNWNDPETYVVLIDKSEVEFNPPPPERAFDMSVRGRFGAQAPITEAIFLAMVDSARAAGADVQSRDAGPMSRNRAWGSESVYIRGRSTS